MFSHINSIMYTRCLFNNSKFLLVTVPAELLDEYLFPSKICKFLMQNKTIFHGINFIRLLFPYCKRRKKKKYKFRPYSCVMIKRQEISSWKIQISKTKCSGIYHLFLYLGQDYPIRIAGEELPHFLDLNILLVGFLEKLLQQGKKSPLHNYFSLVSYAWLQHTNITWSWKHLLSNFIPLFRLYNATRADASYVGSIGTKHDSYLSKYTTNMQESRRIYPEYCDWRWITLLHEHILTNTLTQEEECLRMILTINTLHLLRPVSLLGSPNAELYSATTTPYLYTVLPDGYSPHCTYMECYNVPPTEVAPWPPDVEGYAKAARPTLLGAINVPLRQSICNISILPGPSPPITHI